MNAITLEQAAGHGIVTDLARLLKSRHWAQHLKLFSQQAARSMLLGNMRSRHRGRGMEFEEVRRYQAGDDIRTIDWKVSARVGKTYTKLFCEERELPCHIIVDQRSSLFFGSQTRFKSVLAAELATAIAWAALAGGDRVGGQVIGDTVEHDSRARRSKQAVLKLIHNINETNRRLMSHTETETKAETTKASTKTSLANSLEECRRITRPGTTIFIISDFHDFDDSTAKALSNLGKHCDISLLHISDPIEDGFPITGKVSISNGQQSSAINISKELKNDYQSAISERLDLLKSSASKSRASYAKVSTEQAPRQTLIKLFGI